MRRFTKLLFRGVAISVGIATAIMFFAVRYQWDSVISDAALVFWAVVGIGASFSALIAFVIVDTEATKRAEQEAEKAKKEAEALALEQQRQEAVAAAQRSFLRTVDAVVADAKGCASKLPKLVQVAERAIDTAEQEFAEGVFAPFWDAVETATTNLAEFEHIVQLLVQRSQDYRNVTAKFLGPAPAFDLGFKVLPDATHASGRLKAIVRQAQKNPHFATIYELRKTNEILVEGFTNLGQALTEVGDRLENSMDTLRSSLTEGFAEVASSNQKATEELAAQMEQTREQASKDSEARRKHEREEREMLDNIQRRKKPRS